VLGAVRGEETGGALVPRQLADETCRLVHDLVIADNTGAAAFGDPELGVQPLEQVRCVGEVVAAFA
jgi:hypothetical protein